MPKNLNFSEIYFIIFLNLYYWKSLSVVILKKRVIHFINFSFSNDFFQFSSNQEITLNHQCLNEQDYFILQIWAIKEAKYRLINFLDYQFLLNHLKEFFHYNIPNFLEYHSKRESHLY